MAFGAVIYNSSGNVVADTTSPVFVQDSTASGYHLIAPSAVVDRQNSDGVTVSCGIIGVPLPSAFAAEAGYMLLVDLDVGDIIISHGIFTGSRRADDTQNFDPTEAKTAFLYGSESLVDRVYRIVKPAITMPPPTSGFGMVFYDEAGNVTMSSEWETMAIRAFGSRNTGVGAPFKTISTGDPSAASVLVPLTKWGIGYEAANAGSIHRKTTTDWVMYEPSGFVTAYPSVATTFVARIA